MKEKQIHKKQFGWGYVLFGILLIFVGGCFVGIQDTFEKLAIAVGAFAIAFGGILCLISLFSKGNGIVFIFKFVLSGAIIAGGIFTIIYKEPAIRILMDCFCLLLIVDGAFKLQDAIKGKGGKVALWGFIALLSLCVIGVAFYMTKRSFNDEKTRSIVFGCTVLVDGISNFFTAFLLRQLNDNEVAEIEKELRESQTDKEMENLKEKMDKLKKEMEDMQKAKEETLSPTAEPMRESATQKQAEEQEEEKVEQSVCEEETPVEEVAITSEQDQTEEVDEKETVITSEEEQEVEEFFAPTPAVEAEDCTLEDVENQENE